MSDTELDAYTEYGIWSGDPERDAEILQARKDGATRWAKRFRELGPGFARWRLYREYLKSEEWQTIRYWAFRIHGFNCACCGTRRRLEVDHRHYDTVGDEDPRRDLQILCYRCHMRKHHEIRMARVAARSGSGGS